jgi:hypothetical protein
MYGPIATFPAADDFAFVAIAGRAYISPLHTLVNASGQAYTLGLQGEYVYVYHGDGSQARKTGGAAPTNGGLTQFTAYNDIRDGSVTKGIHLIVVSFNNGTVGPTIAPIIEAPGNVKVQLIHIPIGPAGTASRKIWMTKAIDPKDYIVGAGFTFYLAADIPDNTTVEKLIDVTDAQLTVALGVPDGSPTPINTALAHTHAYTPGYCDLGLHIIAVIYETESGFLTGPGPEFFSEQTYVSVKNKILIINIPVSPDPFVTKRHIISTKAIVGYNGDQKGYQFYFIPGGNIDNNTVTQVELSYYDSDLVDDASHLIDNYTNIPAGVNLTTFHGRLVVVGLSTKPEESFTSRGRITPRHHVELDNRSVALLSAPGEPEAISKVDGLIITPLDGNALTHCQEFRDILYLFKRSRTYAYVDNFDEPASWQEQVLDQGIGASIHGIASVLDSGGVNADFLIIVDSTGVILFNGTYTRPELTFKIEDFWLALNRNNFHRITIANDSVGKKLYITLPEPFRHFVLYGDYNNGLDAKNIRWSKWVFDGKVTSACLIETNKLILGVDIVGG